MTASSIRRPVLGALLLLAAPGMAHAVPIGYQLDLVTGNANVPTFNLTNLATSALDITGFNFTIGNTARHFDFVTNIVAGGVSFTLNSPDTVNDGVRSDEIDFDFTGGFGAGVTFGFDADVDDDPANNVVLDYRTVFFNNGAAPNSVISVEFTGGSVLSLTLPENPAPLAGASPQTFRFGQTADVPEPGSLALMVAALLGVGRFAQRRAH